MFYMLAGEYFYFEEGNVHIVVHISYTYCLWGALHCFVFVFLGGSPMQRWYFVRNKILGRKPMRIFCGVLNVICICGRLAKKNIPIKSKGSVYLECQFGTKRQMRYEAMSKSENGRNSECLTNREKRARKKNVHTRKSLRVEVFEQWNYFHCCRFQVGFLLYFRGPDGKCFFPKPKHTNMARPIGYLALFMFFVVVFCSEPGSDHTLKLNASRCLADQLEYFGFLLIAMVFSRRLFQTNFSPHRVLTPSRRFHHGFEKSRLHPYIPFFPSKSQIFSNRAPF